MRNLFPNKKILTTGLFPLLFLLLLPGPDADPLASCAITVSVSAAAEASAPAVSEASAAFTASSKPAKEGTAEGETALPDLDPHGEGALVTQFGDVNANQEMCYTITTADQLVIVDGGWGYEAPLLRSIIAKYGNTVDAWILTHPHEDHITAFMDIYDDPQGITIQKVYAVEMPDMETLVSNASWDDYTTLERFLSMDIPELTYVQTGDTWEDLGLTFTVLSAYSDLVDELSDDLLNDGSMLFRVDGKATSMLFCADVGKSMSSWLTDTYGESLKADAVQMGHHGYGGLKKKFYRLADCDIAFFDAPESLMSGENEKSTEDKVELMEELGAEILWYNTAPNQFLIQ